MATHPNPRPRMIASQEKRIERTNSESWWTGKTRGEFYVTARTRVFDSHPDAQPKHQVLSLHNK